MRLPFSISELPTPVPVVALDVLRANVERVAGYAREHRLRLRPHVKTHKALEIARQQLAAGAAGLTCATVHEGEVMRGVCDDILIAYPPSDGHRARGVAALAERGPGQTSVFVDSEVAVREIGRAARERGVSVGVLVELDVGMRRTGVSSAVGLAELAAVVADTPALRFQGIAFYAGHIRERVTEQDAKIGALNELIGEAMEGLGKRGMRCDVLSGGSTPTLFRSHEIIGLTEIRPGTYVFNDRTTALIGACGMEDCALTVLATVVSTSVEGQAVIDAGVKALGREPLRGSEGVGYGSVLEHPEVVVDRMSEEHGMLDLRGSSWRPSVGERVRIVPNHVCIVVQLNDVVYGVCGDEVVASWRVDARGRG